jgi:diacylglycerol kinase (ATP)
LVEIGNGPRAGGGFLLTPDADPADGALDFCLIRPVSLLTLARIFPAAARGERFEHPAVYRLRDTGATLTLPGPVAIHLDGEPTTLPEGDYRVRLQPSQLGVLAQHVTGGGKSPAS